MLLPEGDEREARHVAGALCGAVRTIGRGAAANGGAATVTASVGIAVFEGGEGARAAETLNRADLAMYEAKQGGRDGLPPGTPTADPPHRVKR